MVDVTFSTDWTDSSGRSFKGGQTAAVDPGTARLLFYRGRARAAEPVPEASAAEPTVPATPAKKKEAARG